MIFNGEQSQFLESLCRQRIVLSFWKILSEDTCAINLAPSLKMLPLLFLQKNNIPSEIFSFKWDILMKKNFHKNIKLEPKEKLWKETDFTLLLIGIVCYFMAFGGRLRCPT